MRGIALGLLASVVMVVGAPKAHAGTLLCRYVPSCAAQSNPNPGNHNPAPEPGTLGLLALGAAASVRILRRKKQ